LALRQAWRDGTSHIVFTPHELIEKLNRREQAAEVWPAALGGAA